MDTGASEEANVRPGYFCLARPTYIYAIVLFMHLIQKDNVLFSTIKKQSDLVIIYLKQGVKVAKKL